MWVMYSLRARKKCLRWLALMMFQIMFSEFYRFTFISWQACYLPLMGWASF